MLTIFLAGLLLTPRCPAAFQVNGSGAAVFENPVNSLVFLAEELGKFGHTLKAGGKTAILSRSI